MSIRVMSVPIVLLAALACTSDGGQLTVIGGVDCRYSGPTEIAVGRHDLILSPEGAGEFRVEVYRLLETTHFDDIVAHYQSESAGLSPPGSDRELTVEGTGVRTLTRSHHFAAGRYVIVCHDLVARTAGEPLAELTVDE